MKAFFSRVRHGKNPKSTAPTVEDKPQPPIPPDKPSYPSSSSVDHTLSNPDDSTRSSIHARDPSHTSSIRSDNPPSSSGASSSKPVPDAAPSVDGPPTAKKTVNFVSPPPTPAPPLSRYLSAPDVNATSGPSSASVPQALRSGTPAPRRTTDSQRSTSTASKAPAAVDTLKASGYSASTRMRASPVAASRSYAASALADSVSIRSGSPLSHFSGRTGIQAAASWSEAAEEDLVVNIGPRERTRQEVLWEIVASEDRFVVELLKMKETFIDPLLHPYSSVPPTSPTHPDPTDEYYFRSESPQQTINDPALNNLPIASRFLSSNPHLRPAPPSSAASRSRTPIIPPADGESGDDEEDQLGRGYASGKNKVPLRSTANSPYGTGAARGKSSRTNLPFPSRSHYSLPPPPRPNPNAASTTSLGRQSMLIPPDQERQAASTPAPASSGRSGKKLKKGGTSQSVGLAPHLLPEDLRQCLEVLENGILSGHLALSEGLRKRYEEQYPLVRSLADVFVSNSHILRGYATYVLHLERALEQVDNALSGTNLSKKAKKQDDANWQQVSKVLKQLEDNAADKGETGLAISLSKPFQRLLKYPLLFQNLLFHTDPSTFEYESTLHMVAEVEKIVRSIEDEKIKKEERDQTRDAIARIEGLDKVKALAAPKASRQLLEERLLVPPSTTPPSAASKANATSPAPSSSKTVQQKSSFRRLSDVLHPGANTVGSKKDIWLVIFNDVVLRCQRTGTTTLPIATTLTSRSHSLPDLQGKGKYNTVGRRSQHTPARNLYKFIKIETWTIGDINQPRAGIVSMEDITRSRSIPTATATVAPVAEAEEGGDSDSDGKSKMSFSYWGAEKITLRTPPVPKTRTAAPVKTGTARRSGVNAPTSYSTANAKFGTRLRSPEPGHDRFTSPTPRPESRQRNAPSVQSSVRRTASGTRTPTSSTANHTHRSVTSPSLSGTTATATSRRTPRIFTPQTTAASTAQPVAKLVPIKSGSGSPTPSEITEDSGVGFHRDAVSTEST